MKIFNNYYYNKCRFGFYFNGLIFGIILSIKFIILGEIYLLELISSFYTIYILFFKNLKISKFLKNIIKFSLFWSFCQIISDNLNGAKLDDSLKGIIAPLLFSMSLAGLTLWLKRNLKYMPSLGLGIVLGLLIQNILFPNENFINNPWKWGFGVFFMDAALLRFSFLKSRNNFLFLALFFIIFCSISLENDSRGQSFLPFLAFLIFYILNIKDGKNNMAFNGNKGFLKLFIILLIILLIIKILIPLIYTSDYVLGMISAESAEKYFVQASGDYGMLLGGRSEIFISLQAFLDKPFFGHGSWALDKSGYIDQFLSIRESLGYFSGGDESEWGRTGLIPYHSFIMGAAVWAGIGGFLFWVYILYLIIILFKNSFQQLPIYYYVGLFSCIWAIFFSPFGALNRFNTVVFLAFYFSYISFINIKSLKKYEI